jgi:hypothetical protein
MARAKQYNEQEVIENDVFVNGYESTRSYVGKEMGINQFSIYASFGSNRVFLKV